MRERSSVRVLDGGVLREGEVDGVVGNGEGGKLYGGDGDPRVSGFEDSEVNDECDDDDEDEEDGGDDAGGEVGSAGGRPVRFAHCLFPEKILV